MALFALNGVLNILLIGTSRNWRYLKSFCSSIYGVKCDELISRRLLNVKILDASERRDQEKKFSSRNIYQSKSTEKDLG